MARHNKKRNVGLVYEFLTRRLGKAVVENDHATTDKVKKIFKKHFKKNSQLYKEFRLFNALVETSSMPGEVAVRIIDESKKAATDYDSVKLDREKSLLIKDINYKIDESDFFNTKVENYQMYATVQQLLDHWRNDSQQLSIKDSAVYEKKLHEWLTKPDQVIQEVDEHKTTGVNDLTLKIMKEKFESKFGSQLNETQARLLTLFAENKHEELVDCMKVVSEQSSNLFKKYHKNSSDKYLREKVENVRTRIVDTGFSPDIDGVSRCMQVCQLTEEIKGIENV